MEHDELSTWRHRMHYIVEYDAATDTPFPHTSRLDAMYGHRKCDVCTAVTKCAQQGSLRLALSAWDFCCLNGTGADLVAPLPRTGSSLCGSASAGCTSCATSGCPQLWLSRSHQPLAYIQSCAAPAAHQPHQAGWMHAWTTNRTDATRLGLC